MRFDAGPNDPSERYKTCIESIDAVRELRLRDIHRWSRIAIQTVVSDIPYHTDDLTGKIRELRTNALTNDDAVRQRIAVGPELLGHCLIDDRHRRRAGGVLISESAASQYGDLEHIEVSGRVDHVSSAAGGRSFQRSSHNNERQPEATFQRHTAGSARINNARQCLEPFRALADQ